jgi:peptide/nickel transport system permease protein
MSDRPKIWNSIPGRKSHIGVRVAWCFIGVIAILAVFGPLVANEKPYYCKLDGNRYYPLFSKINEATLSVLHPAHAPVDWYTTEFESIWRAPVPYSHHTIDLKSGIHVSPFDAQAKGHRFRHWLGTDIAGRDVLAGMIRGCRVSLLIGLGSMLLAMLIGVPLGTMAAYWGNKEKKISRMQVLMIAMLMVMVALVLFLPVATVWKWIVVMVIAAGGYYLFKKTFYQRRATVSLPVDQWVMGGISIVDGFPAMFLILILIALLPVKGWLVVLLVIALLRWPMMARYIRAEVFRMKESNYIKAAQIVNLPDWRIMTRHIIPYAFRPVMVSFIFGVSSAILAESTLSFLGIGLPVEEINWGRLLAQSRNHFDAWWLVLFPGCALFFTLLSLYTIGNAWEKEVGS